MTTHSKLDGKSYLSFRRELEDRGIVFSYSGYLNEDILTGIGNALRTKLEIDQTDQKISRGVFSAFVEQVQNVIRYSAETVVHADRATHQENVEESNKTAILPYGLLAIGEHSNGQHFVTCCNMIHSSDTTKLKGQLDSIRGLDRKALGSLMRDQLRNGPPEGSKGAGVGFISIAREANGNWNYDIVENAEENLDFFCFEANF
jgi:hypothetical protein